MDTLTTFFRFLFDEINVATTVLFAIFVVAALVAHAAQKRPDFDFADMLRDPITNKPSANRLAIFVSLAISSWILMYAALNIDKKQLGSMLVTLFEVFMGIWSGAKVVEKAIDAYAATRGAPLTPSLNNMIPTGIATPPVVTPPAASTVTATTVPATHSNDLI